MGNHPTVLNASTGWRIKRSQAKRRIEQGLSAWVEHNVSIRDLNLPERIAFQKAKLPFGEVFGVHYEPAGPNQASHWREQSLMKAANRWVKEKGQA